jgi:VWFA-related protein
LRLRALIVVLVCCLAALPASAQYQTLTNDSGVLVGSDTPAVAVSPEGLLHFDVVVTASSDRPVITLPASDFALLDNGKPVDLVSFRSHSVLAREPLNVVIVLDTLQITSTIDELEHEHLERFLRLNDGHLPAPVTVLELTSSGIWRVGETSSDGNVLADAVAHNRISKWDGEIGGGHVDRGGEQFQTSLMPNGPSIHPYSPSGPPGEAGLRALGAIATVERRNSGRKLLLWIGPAYGIGSGVNPEENARIPQEKLAAFDKIVWFSDLFRLARLTLCDDPVYDLRNTPPALLTTVAPVTGPQDLKVADSGIPALNRQVLTLESGGRVVDLSHGDPVAQLSGCLRDAQSTYTLSFNPPAAKQQGEFHSLSVKVRESELTARISPGYYNQPWYSNAPDATVRRLTVAQFDELLRGAHTASDGDLARQLAAIQLTERASSAQIASWTASISGKRSREALLALADFAAFLPPPPSTVPADPPPDADTQRKLIERAVNYVKETIPHLPNFFARRTELSYLETPSFYRGDGHFTHAEPLHVADTTRTNVEFRDGQEVIDAKVAVQEKKKGSLSTYGTFGPAMGVILTGLTGDVVWSRWETGENGGRLAVFRYAVPLADSRSETGGCCLPDGDGRIPFRTLAPYHGLVTIDPDSGAVLRATIESDLGGFVPIDEAKIMIVYGPVVIGDRSYICPVSSVSYLRLRAVNDLSEWGESYLVWGPYVTQLQDFRFDTYHTFRADARILPADPP